MTRCSALLPTEPAWDNPWQPSGEDKVSAQKLWVKGTSFFNGGLCVCVLNYWIEYTVYTHLNICSDSPGSHSRLDPSTTMHHPPSSSSSSPSSSPHDSMPRTLPVLERLPLLRACSKTCRYFELKDFSSSETFSDPTQAGRSKLSGRYPLVRPLMGPWASVGWHIMLLVATCS